MADQNILSGGVEVLDTIVSDLKEHNTKVDILDNLERVIKDMSKELENVEHQKQSELQQRIASETTAVCADYDKTIEADRVSVRTVQVERDNAKKAGVQDRIQRETKNLCTDNEALKNQITDAFDKEKIPRFFNSRAAFVMFMRRDVADYAIYALAVTVMLLIVPLVLVAVLDEEVSGIVVTLYGYILIMIALVFGCIVERRIINPHRKTISDARFLKDSINANNKVIANITKGIHSDKNEDMYNLGHYDARLNELNAHISEVKGRKAEALKAFEEGAKLGIVEQIEDKYREQIEQLHSDLAKKRDESASVSDLVNRQRQYIAANYEAYLGREFMSLDKLCEMQDIMRSGVAETVSQAMAAYRDRH